MGSSNVDDIYELSPLQQGMLLHSVYDGAADMYLSQQSYEAEGTLDSDALVLSWQAVVKAHPSLRTSFHWDGLDKPLQVVHRHVDLPVHRHDWSELDAQRQGERLDQLRAADRTSGFDLTRPPLQRLHLIKLAPNRHTVIWTYHHLLLDGWSVPILMGEVLAHYRALVAGGPPVPASPPFRDYIAWLQRQDPAAAKAFWADSLAAVVPSRLLALRTWDPQQGTGPVERRIVHLRDDIARGLRQTAARHHVTFSTIVQAAWAIVVATLTGRSDVMFGCATSGRPAELHQVQRMVGMFANTLPVRVRIPEFADLGSWLRDVQTGYAQTRRYEYTSLSDVKKWAGLPGQQLFDSLLVLENYSLVVDTQDIGGQLTFRRDSLYDKISFPLTLTVAPDPVSEVQLLIHRDRFGPGFIDEILARLHTTFDALVGSEDVATVVSAAGPISAAGPEPARRGATRMGGTPGAPATPLEETIAEAFRDVLSVSDIDLTESFFEMGGDSFDAVRLIGRVDGANLGILAENPSVRQLAAALSPAAPESKSGLDEEIAELERLLAEKRAQRGELQAFGPILAVPRDGDLPCAFQQEGVWFMHQANPASTSYHVPFVLRLRGGLDVAALGRALDALVARHEALRTRFVSRDGVPRQVIEPPPVSVLRRLDLSPSQVTAWAKVECDRPFDLAAGPPLRAAVARLAPDDHVLLVVVHHIVGDGWSTRILAGELSALYAAEAAGLDAGFAPLPAQPADYAVWQRRWLSGEVLQRRIAFWRDRLAGLSVVDFPADRPRPTRPTFAGAAVSRRVHDDTAAAAHEYARRQQVSLLAILYAALTTVLHRYTGQTDLPVGSFFAGRTHPDTETMASLFGNTVVLRTDVDANLSFGQLVQRCNTTVQDASAHQDIAFHLVVDALRPERLAGRNPLFQIGLTLLPLAISDSNLALGDISAEPITVEDDYALYDMAFEFADAADGRLELSLEYSTELFNAVRMNRLADDYVVALAAGLAAPDTPISGLKIGTGDERFGVVRDGHLARVVVGQQVGADGSAVGGSAPTTEFASPRTATERWLAGVWRDVIGAERIAVTDNFFDLGGSSLLTMRVLARVHDEMGVAPHPWDLFANPVLAEFAAFIDRTRSSEPASAPALSPAGLIPHE